MRRRRWWWQHHFTDDDDESVIATVCIGITDNDAGIHINADDGTHADRHSDTGGIWDAGGDDVRITEHGRSR